MTAALQSLVQEIRVSSLTNHVRNYQGEGTAKFYSWLTDMDQLASTIDSDRMCVLATLTLGGPAGLYVARLTKTPITWTDLRRRLRDRYGEAEDPRIAREKLRHIRQNKGETVQNYAERLRAAANDFFDNVDSDEAQGLLVDTFQRGLKDDRLTRALIKKNCKNLDELENAAITEQQIDKIFHLYRRDEPEPMEVDMVRKDEVDELRKKVSDLEKKLDQAKRAPPRQQPQAPRRYNNQAQGQTYPQAMPPPPQMYRPPTRPAPPPPHMYTSPPPPLPAQRHRWTPDGRPICSSCGRIGHTSRSCRAGN